MHGRLAAVDIAVVVVVDDAEFVAERPKVGSGQIAVNYNCYYCSD